MGIAIIKGIYSLSMGLNLITRLRPLSSEPQSVFIDPPGVTFANFDPREQSESGLGRISHLVVKSGCDIGCI